MNTRSPSQLLQGERKPLFRRRDDGAVSLNIPAEAAESDTLGRANCRGVSIDLYSSGEAESVMKRNPDGSMSIDLS